MNTFTEKTWDSLHTEISGSFRLNDQESETLKTNSVAKLIGAIPFLAGCEEPERISLTHLGTYMLAKDPASRSVFEHRESDNEDLLKRVSYLNHFESGDKKIIRRGMDLLALIQLKDHYHDTKEDMEKGKYNPVSAGAWDYAKTYKELVERISAIPCPQMDSIMPVGIDTTSWWDPLNKD